MAVTDLLTLCVRVCSVSTTAGVRLIWERDGVLIDSLPGALQLQLGVHPVQLVDEGHYTCRVEFSASEHPNQPTLPPVSAGTLTVLGKA